MKNLIHNIKELSPVAHILVSDDTELDSTLAKLKREFQQNPNVEFVGKRDIPPGWVAHCNSLKGMATSEFFMWLPHDDSTQSQWIVRGEQALQNNSAAVMALGSLCLISHEGPAQLLLPSPENEILDPVERVSRALIRQFVTKEPGFGHSFRGLQRRESSPNLPLTTPEDLEQPEGWKADVFWSLEALSIGTFAVIEAGHQKYEHTDSESSNWALENNVAGFRIALSKHLNALSPTQRLEVITNVWDAEATKLREIHRNQQQRIKRLQQKDS